MRLLVRNARMYWLIRVTGYTDNVDADGNYTGEKVPEFDPPIRIRLNTMPVNGTIDVALQGFVGRYDQVALSEIELLENDLLIKTGFDKDLEDDWKEGIYEPSTLVSLDKIYDYKVGSKLESINISRYGLKARI
jgi:hypothetical protein